MRSAEARSHLAHLATLPSLASELAAGRISSAQLVDECLARIEDPQGEGGRTFLALDADAKATASRIDAERRAGRTASRYAGIPISIKDLFDVRGQQTRAASRVLSDVAPAMDDAPAIARLRNAGLIPIGRTNMTEFAYSALGINPHFGTPRNPFDRATGRIPGGSSSGAAVSVTDEMAVGAIGSDTGGSCRIPAALCGIVGLKPTASRIPKDGTVPLSTTLDTVGVLTRTVECAAALFDILSGGGGSIPDARPAKRFTLVVPTNYMLEGLDPATSGAFERTLSALSSGGVRIAHRAFPLFDAVPRYTAKGSFSAYESYRWHRQLIERKRELYDPRVLERIMMGAEQSDADYAELNRRRASFIDDIGTLLARDDLLAFPTTPLVAPPIAELTSDVSRYRSVNALMLRNSSVVNFFDGCAISLPIHEPGTAPVGLTLAALRGADEALLGAARTVETLLRP